MLYSVQVAEGERAAAFAAISLIFIRDFHEV